MKALLALVLSLSATSAFAGVETIVCANNSNSDLMLSIASDSQSKQILGASLYNVDWGQTAEGHFQKAIAVGAPNPVAGVQVVLEDKQTLDIDYSIFDAGHEGQVLVNGQDEYHCF